MKFYHGAGRIGVYFEGWYLKHQHVSNGFAVIPAIHMQRSGAKKASIQIITQMGAGMVEFPGEQFEAGERESWVRIGDNLFSTQGIRLNLSTGDLAVRGSLRYGPLTPLQSDIMGPFQYVPFLQCRHGVISMGHRLEGELQVNGKVVNYTGGTGYVETDRGRSFPRAYLWTQCVWKEGSVMLSIADIPMPGGSFTGCICAVLWDGQEYRLATYQGVKIQRWSSQGALVQQGALRLEVELLEAAPHPLSAPVSGGMTRTIHESLFAKIRYRFWKGNHLLFDHTDLQASFEFAGGQH